MENESSRAIGESCPACGAPVRADAHEGLCPRCGIRAAIGVFSETSPSAIPEPEFGPYRLLDELGEGGMGKAYLAEQCEPVRRLVAIKLLKSDAGDPAAVARFEAERQVLARLDHSSIAKIFDAGTTPGGRPFIAMELIDGLPITDYCERNALSVSDRLSIFIDVCRAVQHAHRRGIIHRDLKPSNIHVTESAEGPLAKIIDFGIAKAFGIRLGAADAGTVLGTPEYMSPEQSGAEPDVDTRTDVYALGAILHELLTGNPPRREADVPATMVRDEDLGWVICKATAGDRESRYGSAEALAADLENFLAGGEVEAHPPAASYRMRKFARRNRGALAAVTVIVLALVGGILATTWQAVEATRARDEVREKEREQRIMLAEASRSDHEEALRKWESGIRDDAIAYAARALRFDPENTAAGTLLGNLLLAHGAHRPPTVVKFPIGSLHDFVFAGGNRLLTSGGGGVRLWGPGGKLIREFRDGARAELALSPDGSRVAAGYDDGSVRVWDFETGEEVAVLEEHSGDITFMAFDSTGEKLATASEDRSVRIWDLASRSAITVFTGHRNVVTRLAFQPNGNRIASTDRAAVLIWDPLTGELDRRIRDSEGWGLRALLFTPDGSRLVTGNHVGSECRVWDVATGEQVDAFQNQDGDPIFEIALSPSGDRLALATLGISSVPIRDLNSGEQVCVLEGHEDGVLHLAFSPDGLRIATASRDETVRVWDARTGESLAVLRHGKGRPPRELCWSKDGSRLAVPGPRGEAWIRNVPTALPEGLFSTRLTSRRLDAGFSPDGNLLLIPDTEAVSILDAASMKALRSFRFEGEKLFSAEFSADGERILTRSGNGNARLWRTATGEPLAVFVNGPGSRQRAVIDSSGRQVATHAQGKPVRLWEVDDPGEPSFVLDSEGAEFSGAISFDREGGRIACGTLAGSVLLFDTHTGERLAVLEGHTRGLTIPKFMPSGGIVSVCQSGSKVLLWRENAGKFEKSIFRSHRDGILDLALTEDGNQLATGAIDGSIRIWDLPSGDLVHALDAHRDRIYGLDFSGGGRFLASASQDGAARIWDTRRGVTVALLRGGGTFLLHARLHPAGDRVTLSSVDGVASVHSLFPPAETAVESWVHEVLAPLISGRTIDENGAVNSLIPIEQHRLRRRLEEQFSNHTDTRSGEASAQANGGSLVRCFRWYLEDSRLRTLSPSLTATVPDWVAGEALSGDPARIRAAYRVSPAHPLIHLALSGLESDPDRAGFLRTFGLERLADPENIETYGPETMERFRQIAGELLGGKGITEAILPPDPR